MLESEKKHWKISMGRIYLSPTLTVSLKSNKMWNLINLGVKIKYISPSLILIETTKTDLSNTLNTSLEEAERGFKWCVNEVYCSKTQATVIRQDFLYKIGA